MKLETAYKIFNQVKEKVLAFVKDKSFLLFLLSFAIFFSPRFRLGMIPQRFLDVRLEDILLALFCFALALGIIKIRKEWPPFSKIIIAFLTFELIIGVINLFLGNVILVRLFFYFLKDVEFFLIYFFVFCYIKDIGSILKTVKYWIYFGLINLIYLVFQLLSRMPMGELRRGVHYIGGIGEIGIFPMSGFYLILFISLLCYFLFNFFQLKIWQKLVYGISILGYALGIVGLSRRSCVGALAVCLVVLVFLYFKKTQTKVSLKAFLMFFGIVAVFLVFAGVIFLTKVSYRPEFLMWDKIVWGIDVRLGFWKERIGQTTGNIFSIIFGMGKSYLDESHNNFVRNFNEGGIIGSIMFLFLIFSILKKTLVNFFKEHNNLKISLMAGSFICTVAMLIISLPADAFTVVKISEVYWFFMGLTMASLTLKEDKE